MKFRKAILLLSVLILGLSLFAASYGVFSNASNNRNLEFISWSGEEVELYGDGLYKNDSVSGAEQEIAQDIVTLALGIPFLLLSLLLVGGGSIRGRFLLAGTLGYFLYTYASYSFLSTYNSFFLVYVFVMSASFFAFLLTLMSFDLQTLKNHFQARTPVKFIGGLLIFIGGAVLLMWLSRILPSLVTDKVPYGLDHYTTLVIQALDIGFIVPGGIVAGILLIKRNAFGYLLAPVFVIKGVTLLTAITMMSIRMRIAGVETSLVEIVLFTIFNMVIFYALFLILKNIKEPTSRTGNRKMTRKKRKEKWIS
ncbi:hypothetical protein [Mesobacillus maritimus]|uniref:hypothetical protein n=1 Tax=Mesobacillus maritimus TaxID=1643336 RepID=UPI00384D0EB6